MSSSSKAFHTQLKSFCYGIEQDARKLRQIVENKPSNSVSFFDTSSEVTYIETLSQDVQKMDENLDKIMVDVLGNPDKRLAHVTMEELYLKCRSLYEVSEGMITSLENHLTKFGYKENPKRMLRKMEEAEDQENNQNCANLPIVSSSVAEFDQFFIDPALMDDDTVPLTVQAETVISTEVEGVGQQIEMPASPTPSALSPVRSIFDFDGPKTPSLKVIFF